MDQTCPLPAGEHHDPPPADDALPCGHCDGYIRPGMFVDHCDDHGWVCETCSIFDTAKAVTG